MAKPAEEAKQTTRKLSPRQAHSTPQDSSLYRKFRNRIRHPLPPAAGVHADRWLPSSKYTAQFQKLCQPGIRVLLLVIVLVAFAVLSFQGFIITPGDSSSPLFPVFGEGNSPSSSSTHEGLGEVSLPSDSKGFEQNKEMDGSTDGDPDDTGLDGEETLQDGELSIDLGHGAIENSVDAGKDSSVGMDEEPDTVPSSVSYPASSYLDEDKQVMQINKSGEAMVSSSGKKPKRGRNKTVPRSEEKKPWGSSVSMLSCGIAEDPLRKKRKKRIAVTMAEMNEILLRNRGSPCSMAPRWSSPNDQQILEVKKQILEAPIVEDDPELYSPAFRNFSMFKRSYDLMERVLKVYVYKEGDKPIFHQPPLTGIYASEGWFMKQMGASRHFVVDDPGKAHLFYMPFSSTRLRSMLYDTFWCGHRKLIQYLKNYVDAIAGKYAFWNRTGGADHFLVACHDWATAEIAKAMGGSIGAFCNADVTEGFELGRDVSLPETNVRSERDPLRDLGGRPAKKRPLLAFFAGRMHGYLRTILLQHWENKDPDLKVFGPLTGKGGGGRGRKAVTYAQYMKSSRYCICPRGNEVNSPRVVEAIFYGCVPVIISDNFVPPFFEVLNWEAFSVVVAERDVPRLKEVLMSISWKRYLALETGVRMVQRHFLWHNQPVKYDMFHMILHSIWFNRVLCFQAN